MMTYKEAIEAIDNTRVMVTKGDTNKFRKAIAMALEVLKEKANEEQERVDS